MYIVYRTTNNLNNKIYVGVHKTNDIDNDCYYGSGKYYLFAQNKYGKWNFSREVLYIYYSREVAYKREKYIVNKDFLEREDTYNIKLGGIGGWSHCHNNVIRNKSLSTYLNRYGKLDYHFSKYRDISESTKLSIYGCKSGNLNTEHTRNLKLVKYGTLACTLNTKEVRLKSGETKKLKYGNLMGACHSNESLTKAKESRLKNALLKYPELNIICEVKTECESIFTGTLYEISKEYSGIRWAVSRRNLIINHFTSGFPFKYGKWKNYYIKEIK